MIKSIHSVLGLMLIFSSGLASAQSLQSVDEVPTNWRIQSYGDATPVLWYTGSTCTNGQITVDSSMSEDAKKTLWAAILSAKAANLKVQVDYTVSGSSCVLIDYAVDGPG